MQRFSKAIKPIESNYKNDEIIQLIAQKLKEYNDSIINANTEIISLMTPNKNTETNGMRKYLIKLGIDIGNEYNLSVLFAETNINKSNKCLERVKCILHIYKAWIESFKNKTESNINIYDLLNYSLCSHYGFCDFLIDFKYVINNRELLGFENERKESKDNERDMCDVNECFIITRHERAKDYYSRNSNQNKQLFFAAKESMFDTEAMQKYICAQQCLDSAHCFVYHCLRIDISALQSNNNNNNQNSTDMSELCKDEIVEKLNNLTKTIRANSNRFRDPNRNTQFSKFMTTNTYKKTDLLLSQESNTEMDTKAVCFVDSILSELLYHKMESKSYNSFSEMITNEEFDTDSIEQDLNNDTSQSNIKDFMHTNIRNSNDTNIIRKICETKLILYKNAINQYQSGFRFFYWAFYKNNTNTSNVIYTDSKGSTNFEENIGYTLGFWYIPNVSETFKEEILNNKTAPFTIDEWNETLFKAKMKYESWLKKPDWKLLCGWAKVDENGNDLFLRSGNRWSQWYGISEGDPITISHLMSLLFYTNFTMQSYEFSASFRRICWNETDESMKKRHSQFHFWAKLLRETVEVFGRPMARSPEKIYYHGIGKELLFQSTDFKIFGPFSTTSRLCVFLCVFLCVSAFYIFVFLYTQNLRLPMVPLQKKKASSLMLEIQVTVLCYLIAPSSVTILMKVSSFLLVVSKTLSSLVSITLVLRKIMSYLLGV